MKTTTPRSPGRPPFHDKAMRHVHVRLDEETITSAKLIGHGNTSAGIRLAVKVALNALAEQLESRNAELEKDLASQRDPSQNGNLHESGHS